MYIDNRGTIFLIHLLGRLLHLVERALWVAAASKPFCNGNLVKANEVHAQNV